MKRSLEIVAGLVLCCLLLMLLEGALGWIHTVRTIQKRIVTSRPWIAQHLDFDPLLGWVNKPNLHIENIFGLGSHFTTDANRLRITPIQEEKKISIICSGDSFTLGLGVGDYETWCSLLTNNNWKTYNLGQDAYGLDQMYLRYERDAKTINHQIHINAIITDDLDRATSPSLFEYFDKPYLTLQGTSLVNLNYPIKTTMGWKTLLTQIRAGLTELHIYKFIQRYLPKQTNDEKNLPIIDAILNEMNNQTKARGGIYVLVLLPTYFKPENEQTYKTAYKKTAQQLEEIASKYNFVFIDIGTSMFQTDRDTYASYFIQPEDLHNTKAGHAYIAKILTEKIMPYEKEYTGTP